MSEKYSGKPFFPGYGRLLRNLGGCAGGHNLAVREWGAARNQLAMMVAGRFDA